MGKVAMKTQLEHDKLTDVAFIDVCEPTANARIEVIDVTEFLGLKSQVLARMDCESGDLLGLIIQDYSAFRREIRLKYVAFAVDRIIDLIVGKVKGFVTTTTSSAHPALC